MVADPVASVDTDAWDEIGLCPSGPVVADRSSFALHPLEMEELFRVAWLPGFRLVARSRRKEVVTVDRLVEVGILAAVTARRA